MFLRKEYLPIVLRRESNSSTYISGIVCYNLLTSFKVKAHKSAGGSPDGKQSPPPTDICSTIAIGNALPTLKELLILDSAP